MKRFAVFVSLCAALLLAPALAWSASETSVRFRHFPLIFRTLNSTTQAAGGVPDSTAITITGIPTTATIDTSLWIDVSNVAWNCGNQGSLQTTYHLFKLLAAGTSIASIDSLPFAIDYQIGGAIVQGSFNAAAGAGGFLQSTAAGTVTGMMTSASLGVNLSGGVGGAGGPPPGVTKIRFRIRCDGNSAARFFGFQAFFVAPVYEPPAINRRVEWKTVPLPWAVQRVGFANGQLAPVDSARTLVGTAASTVISTVTDTTAWLDLSNVAWDAGTQTSIGTAFAAIRIHAAIEGTNTNTDTVFVLPEWSIITNGTAYTPATETSLLTYGAAAYEAILGGSLNTDADAVMAATSVPFGSKVMRLKVRGNNVASALATNVRMFVTLPFYVE